MSLICSALHKLTSDGAYLMKFDDRYGFNDRKMKHPEGLTVHNGKVYVADWGNHLISVFLTDGSYIPVDHREGTAGLSM